MNCNVARDLLAGYNDNVLEEETKKELEKHLADCEKCSKLNENFNAEIKNEKIPDNENIKPFKKVRRKITRRNILVIILTILLLAVLGTVGYLTAGQILKKDDMYSFELIGEDIVGRKFAKSFISGDIDQMLKYVYLGEEDEDGYSVFNQFEESDTIYENLKEKFIDAYKKDFSDKKIELSYVRSYYRSGTITTSIHFYINDEAEQMDIFKITENKYSINICDNKENYRFPEFSRMTKNIDLLLDPLSYEASGSSDIHNSVQDKYIPSYYLTCSMFNNDDDIYSSICEKIDSFQQDGTRINRVFSGRVSYDNDQETFYKLMCFKITDGKTGKSAIYTVKCNIWNMEKEKNGFDFSYEDLLNDGVREEKIQEFKEIYNIS